MQTFEILCKRLKKFNEKIVKKTFGEILMKHIPFSNYSSFLHAMGRRCLLFRLQYS